MFKNARTPIIGYRKNGAPIHLIMGGANTIDDLIDGIEVELEAAQKSERKYGLEARQILETATQEGRHNLTVEEEERVIELGNLRDVKKADIKGIKSRLAHAQMIKAEDLEAERAAKELTPTKAPNASREQRVQVGREERTYHKGNDPVGRSFVKDVVRAQVLGDFAARTRLEQHMGEERVERAGLDLQERAAGTGAFAGLVVPQYLTELYAPVARALRPFANICNIHPLPESGMVVNISRITTGVSAALQSAENAAVSETNIDDTLLSPAVQTAAGQQTLSRQAIERGTGVEDVVIQDLFNAVSTNQDATLLNQASTGLTNVATAVTYTDATPTAGEAYAKIIGAAAGVEAAMLALGQPSHAIMHSRRWYWLASQLQSTFPFINYTNIPPSQSGVGYPDAGYNDGIRGVLPVGLRVVVDNNIATNYGTNEDEIYVVPASECHLWEDSGDPVFLRAEQTAAASLGVLLVAYKYFAYTHQRFANGMQKVGGTGLILPVF